MNVHSPTPNQLRRLMYRHNRAAFLYVALFTLWLLLRLIFFDRFWLLALVNFAAEYYFVPLPVIGLIVIVQRQWRSFTLLLIPTVTFILMFGELFWPSANPFTTQRPPRQPTLTAMSFNVLVGNHNYAAVAAAVRAASPDVVGFEELLPENYAGISAQLKSDYPYYTPPPNPTGGVGVFSRYPIDSAEPFPLPPRNLAIHAILTIAGRRVHVFVVHLSANNMSSYPLDQFVSLAIERNDSRLSEAVRLKEFIAPITEPVIMLCDCNTPDTTQAYQTLSTFLIDSHREAGWGFAHTVSVPNIPFPVQRIDYVWHNTGFIALQTQVGLAGGSDHLPFMAQLAFSSQK